MKKLVVLLVLVLVFPCYGGTTNVGSIDGAILHSIQSPWVIADETTSADTQPTALDKDDERTYRQVVALIAAASSGDDEISIFPIPSKWNSIRLRDINVTKNSGSVINHIYFGTLGDETDCDLTYAGQLTWTTGDQDSMYHQIAFTHGGTVVPKVGDIVTGNTNKKTAVITSFSALTTGTWAAGTAAGTVSYKSATGSFDPCSPTVTLTRKGEILTADAYTHVATVLVQFEYSDTLVIVSKAWNSTWSSITPGSDTIAEAEIDLKGADVMIVVTSTSDADSKLLVKGY